MKEIESFVLSKERWIINALERQQIRAESRESFLVDYGSSIYLQGKTYLIKERPGTKANFDGNAFYMPPGLTPNEIKATCIAIYKHIAKMHLTVRAGHFASKMGVMPAALKINSAKTRWGSCSSKKNLNFSWRLIMAEDSVIDYVVVHELAHLKEMNHSARFWAVVADVLPDYPTRQARLKMLQKRLTSEDWG